MKIVFWNLYKKENSMHIRNLLLENDIDIAIFAYSKSEDRKEEIPHLINDLIEIESKYKTENTLIIGDFNANPFDSELILKNMFNAVLYKEIVRNQDKVIHKSRIYKRFYNPMINYITETNQHYGTYYYSSGIDALQWNCYDQVLVRKELIDNLSDVCFCKSIGKCDLLTKKGVPNKRISDHLPLIVEVNV